MIKEKKQKISYYQNEYMKLNKDFNEKIIVYLNNIIDKIPMYFIDNFDQFVECYDITFNELAKKKIFNNNEILSFAIGLFLSCRFTLKNHSDKTMIIIKNNTCVFNNDMHEKYIKTATIEQLKKKYSNIRDIPKKYCFYSAFLESVIHAADKRYYYYDEKINILNKHLWTTLFDKMFYIDYYEKYLSFAKKKNIDILYEKKDEICLSYSILLVNGNDERENFFTWILNNIFRFDDLNNQIFIILRLIIIGVNICTSGFYNHSSKNICECNIEINKICYGCDSVKPHYVFLYNSICRINIMMSAIANIEKKNEKTKQTVFDKKIVFDKKTEIMKEKILKFKTRIFEINNTTELLNIFK